MPTTTRPRSPGASSCRQPTDAAAGRPCHEGACVSDRHMRLLPGGGRNGGVRRVRGTRALLALCLAALCGTDPAAQPGPAAQGRVSAATAAEPSGQAVTFAFFNRPIVVL